MTDKIRKVKRSEFATFLNITPTEKTKEYSRMNKGITSQTVGYNTNVTEETYIGDDSATKNVDGYNVSIPTPQTAFVGEPVFDYVDNIRRKRLIGTDCESSILMVNIYRKLADCVYEAEEDACTISIDDFGGDGGTSTVLNYTVNINGDPILGYATIDEGGIITFTAGEYVAP